MIEIENSELLELLKKLESVKLSTLTVGHAWGKWLERSARTRIRETKKAPDGISWAPVSTKYQEWIDKNGIRGSLLLRSGKLQNSIGYDLTKWHSGILTLKANAIYARTHQEGRGRIPARAFLGLSKEDEKKLLAITRKFVEDKLK